MRKALLSIILVAVVFGGVIGGMYKAGVGQLRVGDHYFSHETMECIRIFKIVNEKGDLVNIKEDYIQSSIDVYKANGTYGILARKMK